MHRIPLTRREFVGSAVLTGAGAMLPSMALGPSATVAPFTSTPAWAAKPMRWAQLTLVEDDPIHYSTAFWLDYFKRTRSDAVCLSAGGCVAYYPTNVPFHHRSAWLGNRDLVAELVEGCRGLGMSVLLRTDPHATYDDAKAAHPEWIAVDAKGQPRRHWSSQEMWVTCALGPYNFDFMTAVHKEIVSRYKPDGIFLNRWDGSGDCFCEPCRTNFRAATGFELPLTTDIHEPVRRAYFLWRQQRLMSLLDTWNTTMETVHPGTRCVPNNGSGANNSLDDIEISRRAPIFVADRQARRGMSAPWRAGKTAKEYRATAGGKPVVGLFGVGVEEPYRWKDSVTTPAEIRIWALDFIANGMRPWFSKFSGTLHDERWLKGVEDLYVWAEEHHSYLENRSSLAQVAIVYSQQTAWYYGADQAAASVEAPALGWYQALVESRIPFDMVHDRLLTAELLTGYGTLILPNIAALSEAQCEQLRSFVRKGGNLIATYETGLYDETGRARKNFGLADLFGVDWAGTKQGPMLNSYLRLEHDVLPGHAIFQGLEDAPRIINGVSRLEVTPREAFSETPITLIPTYPDLPMEKVYPRSTKTGVSCLYLRRAGGRVAYFPFDIDRTFWEVLAEDHQKLLRNAVRWAAGEAPLLTVEGPGLLDVTLWRSSSALTIHLVNLTNPMAMKGPYRTFFPIGPQTVTLRLPEAMHAREARLLVAGTRVPVTAGGSITVHSILDHELIAIDL